MNEALANILNRRSCRKFKSEQIRPEELDAILEAGTYAPTGRGGQSPLIVAIQDTEMSTLSSSFQRRTLGFLNFFIVSFLF